MLKLESGRERKKINKDFIKTAEKKEKNDI